MTVQVKHGDRSADVVYVANVDISAATSWKLIARAGSQPPVILPCTLQGAKAVVWNNDGTLPVGTYRVELEVTWGLGSSVTVATFPTPQEPNTPAYETLIVLRDLG